MSGSTAIGDASGAGGTGMQSFYYSFQARGAGKSNVAVSSSCSSACSVEEGSAVADVSVPSSSSSSPEVGSVKQEHDAKGKNSHDSQHNNTHSPVCKNCLTSTTPLWRRDEKGAVLCNACGLFLKLHGRPRPISLKTDVIKSRNRKGAHHQQQQPEAEPQHRRSSSDDKKRKQPTAGPEIKNKRAKGSDDSETRDMCCAANTLENLMASDTTKPKIKPKLKQEVLSPSQSATQLPHLSALLENVRSSANPAGLEPLTDRSTVSSPKMFAAAAGPAKPAQNEVIHATHAPNAQAPLPVSQSCSSTSLVRGASMSQRFASPPQGLGAAVPMAQAASALPISTTTSLPYGPPSEAARSLHAGQNPLSILYRNEEEVIRLKTRINELELVTDLYKRHIFDLDEKCRGLQLEIESLKR